MQVFLLKTRRRFTDWKHAAITVRAAKCRGQGVSFRAILTPSTAKETTMFFAPVVSDFEPVFRTLSPDFRRFVRTATRSVQVEQDDKAWTVSLDVPGVSRDELSIQIEDNVIRIETKAEAKRAFKAAYELPQNIDAAASDAKLENGVLTLTLAKEVPVSKARALEIK
jgi:HSP20 family molecular chaperone IbpA